MRIFRKKVKKELCSALGCTTFIIIRAGMVSRSLNRECVSTRFVRYLLLSFLLSSYMQSAFFHVQQGIRIYFWIVAKCPFSSLFPIPTSSSIHFLNWGNFPLHCVIIDDHVPYPNLLLLLTIYNPTYPSRFLVSILSLEFTQKISPKQSAVLYYPSLLSEQIRYINFHSIFYIILYYIFGN